MNKKTDDLIKLLAKDLRPVRLVKFTFLDFFKVIVAGFLCIFISVLILGLRIDVDYQTLNPLFIIDIILLILIMLLSTIAAFLLSVPSIDNKSFYKFPIVVLGLIFITTLYSFLSSPNPLVYLSHGFTCVSEIILISIFPASILFYLIRRAAVLKREISGFLILLSGVSFGLIGVQLTCSDSTPVHAMIWHLIPSSLILAIGIWISKRIIRKI